MSPESIYPDLSLYAESKLLVKPDRDCRPLLKKLEDEMNRRKQGLASGSTASTTGHCDGRMEGMCRVSRGEGSDRRQQTGMPFG